MEETDARLKAVWNQGLIPVILRRGGKGQRLRVRLPYGENNRQWLQNGRRISPSWNADDHYWETPKTWFNDLVERSLTKYAKVYIVQPFREQEKCAPACMNAVGHECQCSCMGANHGVGNDGSWFEISDTFATRWGELHLACRLMTRPDKLRSPSRPHHRTNSGLPKGLIEADRVAQSGGNPGLSDGASRQDARDPDRE